MSEKKCVHCYCIETIGLNSPECRLPVWQCCKCYERIARENPVQGFSDTSWHHPWVERYNTTASIDNE